jgi:hypothetical protein
MKPDVQIMCQAFTSINVVEKLLFSSEKEPQINIKELFPENTLQGWTLRQGTMGQGLVALIFYIMFLLPKENNRFSEEDEREITDILIEITKDFEPGTHKYPNDYIGHIRNAIAHSRMSFLQESNKPEEGIIIFEDDYDWRLVLYLSKCGKLDNKFEEILGKIVLGGNQ